MAITVNHLETRLQIKFNTGNDETGKVVYRVKSLGGIKSSASDEDIMLIAQALGELVQYPVVSIVRVDQSELIDA